MARRPVTPLAIFLFAALLLPPAARAAAVREPGRDGTVLLRNDALTATIDPARGGRLVSLRAQGQAAEMLGGPSVTETVMPPIGTPADLADTPFTTAPTAELPAGAAAVTLTCMLPNIAGGGVPSSGSDVLYYPDTYYSAVRLEKTYLLRADAARLDVVYRLVNTGQKPVTVCLAFHQALGDAGHAGRLFVPAAAGVLTLKETMDAKERAASPWFGAKETGAVFAELGGGWLAGAGPARTGAVRAFDPRFLTNLSVRVDGSGAADALSTDVPVPAGKAETIATWIAPAGVSAVQAATPEMVGGVALLPAGVAWPRSNRAPPAVAPSGAVYPRNEFIRGAVELLALTAQQGTLRLAARTPDGDEAALPGEREVKLAAGEALREPFAFRAPQAGTWVLCASVTRDGKEVFRAEQPVVVEAAGTLPPRPLAVARVGEPHRILSAKTNAFPGPADWQPTLDYQSPHIPYGKPYAAGPVRALWLYPWWNAREAVEVAERIDMQIDFAGMGIAPLHSQKRELDPGEATPAESDNARAQLAKPHDVIVAAQCWTYWPEDVRAEALRQVREEGVGLVLLAMGEIDEPLKEALAATVGSDGPFPDETALVTELGKGRVAIICGTKKRIYDCFFREQGGLPGPTSAEVESVTRTILWAAGKAPAVVLDARLPYVVDTRPGATTAVPVELANHGAAPVRGRLYLTARHMLDQQYGKYYWTFQNYRIGPWWDDLYSKTFDVAVAPGAKQTVELALPPLPAGPYWLSARLEDKAGKVLSYRNQPFRVSSPYSIDDIALSKRTADPTTGILGFTPDEQLLADVTAYEQGGLGRNLEVRFLLIDGDGRMIHREARPAKARNGVIKMRFGAGLSHALHRTLYAVAQVVADGAIVADHRHFIPIYEYPERRPLFRFTQLDNEGWIPSRAFGIDEYNNGGDEDRLIECALQDFSFQAMVGEVVKGPLNKDDVREPCFNNPAYRRQWFDFARAHYPLYSQYAPQGHLFVDEYYYGGLNACQCPWCQAAFRKWVHGEFGGSLAALNAAWGTAYRDWNDVALYVFVDYKAPEAKDWPRACATLRYKSVQMTDFARECAKIGADVAHDMSFGFSGVWKMTPYNGVEFYDQATISPHAYHIVYRDDEIWASFAGRLAVRNWQWYGGKYNPGRETYRPWALLADGTPGMGVFTCQWYSTCYPDGRPYAGPAAYFKNADEIRRGPAKLLLGREQRDPIAIHYSSPSFYVYGLERAKALTDQAQTHFIGKKGSAMMDWPRRVQNFLYGAAACELGPYSVASDQLKRGGFGLRGTPRVILLTYSPAMSPEEAETLKRFVRDGGVLMGGVCPASRNEWGLPWATPLLDEVFGIRHTGAFQAPVQTSGKPDDARVTITKGFDQPLTLNPLVVGAGNVEVTTGEAWGGYEIGGKQQPAMIVNRYGKGTAAFLNFLPLHMNECKLELKGKPEWTPATAAACTAIVKKVVSMAGCAPWARVTTNGEPGGVKLGRFIDGDNTYLVAVAPWGHSPEFHAARRVEIALPRKVHVYDSRRGKYLGFVDKLTPQYEPLWLANFYSLLPYRVTGVTLRPRRPSFKPGDDAAFEVTVNTDGAPGRHVLHVAVYDPAGNERDLYRYNLDAPAGRATGHVFFALNDPPGDWRVRVTDVASGEKAESVIRLAE